MMVMATAGVIASASLGCGSVEGRALVFREPTPPVAQTALFVGQLPAKPYYETGLVQALGTGLSADKPSVLQALREQGRRAGCDAVVRISVERGQTAAHAIGVCVRWAKVDVAPP
jgi:hypothetical protein